MIKKLKLLSVAAFATVVVAASSHAAATTNIILQSISVQFTVYSQGGLTTNKHTGAVTSSIVASSIDTKQFIAMLGTNIATTNKISSSAVLALETTVVLGTSTNVSIVVVDGTNIYAVNSSVIPNFYPESGSPKLYNEVFANGMLVGVSAEMFSAVQDIIIPGVLNVSLSGNATINVTGATIGKGKTASVIPLYESDLTLAGSGAEGTTPVVVSGKVTESFWKVLP